MGQNYMYWDRGMRGPKSHKGYSEYGLGADTEQAANILFGTSPGWEVTPAKPEYPEIDQMAADILGIPETRASGTFSQSGKGRQGKVITRKPKKKAPVRTQRNNSKRSKTPKKQASGKKKKPRA